MTREAAQVAPTFSHVSGGFVSQRWTGLRLGCPFYKSKPAHTLSILDIGCTKC